MTIRDDDTLVKQPAQQQEPVAALQRVMARLADFLDEDQFAEIERIVTNAGVTPPASKPWVGLTEQERNDLEDYCEMIIGKAAFEAIEAKLKEKNA